MRRFWVFTFKPVWVFIFTGIRRHGVKHPERKAALAAMTAMTLVEIGDATSDKFGFSGEDLIADAMGVAASWWLASNPVWDLSLIHISEPTRPY